MISYLTIGGLLVMHWLTIAIYEQRVRKLSDALNMAALLDGKSTTLNQSLLVIDCVSGDNIQLNSTAGDRLCRIQTSVSTKLSIYS